MLDALGPHDAVEVELQVARFLAAVRVLHGDLELPQGVDALHQVLVGTVAPQELDVLGRRGERRRRHQVLEQLLERQAGEIVATEHARQRIRPDRADAVIGVEQEEALAHRLEDVARLLLRIARRTLVTRARDLEVGGRGCEHQRGQHAGGEQRAQPRGGRRGGVLQRGRETRELGLQRVGVVAGEQLRALHLRVMLTPLARQRAAAAVGVDVGLPGEGDHRIEHRRVLVPQQQRPAKLRGVHIARGVDLLEFLVEALDGRLQVRERLPGVGAHFQAVAQRIELVGDLLGVGLQRAGRLQRGDVRAHMRREAETHDQHRAHDQGQRRA